jgi:hypothetical protein
MTFFNKERVLTPSWDLLNPSVELLKKNIWAVLYLAFLPGVFVTVGATMVGNKIQNFSNLPTHVIAGFIVLGLAVIWQGLAYPGYTYMQVQAAKGTPVTPWVSFKKGLHWVLPMLVAFIAAGALILLGLYFHQWSSQHHPGRRKYPWISNRAPLFFRSSFEIYRDCL